MRDAKRLASIGGDMFIDTGGSVSTCRHGVTDRNTIVVRSTDVGQGIATLEVEDAALGEVGRLQSFFECFLSQTVRRNAKARWLKAIASQVKVARR